MARSAQCRLAVAHEGDPEEILAFTEKIKSKLLHKRRGGRNMREQLFSISDCARLLGIQEYQISYWHRVGKVPDVRRVAGKRVYDEADLKSLAEHAGVQLKEAKQ